MYSPLISVIVCTFNRADLLSSCLQSLVEQTIDRSLYEVIVVNNNSTDNTQEVVEEFARRHSNFRLVNEPVQGLSHARNRGYSEAKGEYVAYIDDDAKADKSWVENIRRLTERRPEIVAFGGPYKSFSLVKIPKWYKESYGEWGLGEIERPIADNEWINGTNMVFRRQLLFDLGGFDTRIGMSGSVISYGEETNLLLKIKKRELPIYYVPDIVVEHLIAEYKMNLRWMLKSYYTNGFSGLKVFGYRARPFRQGFITFVLFLKGLRKFLFMREEHLQTRIFESFSACIWSAGLTVRMFRG